MAAKKSALCDYSIISADNLLHGGLLAARMNTATPSEEDELLKQLRQLPITRQQAIFSVIRVCSSVTSFYRTVGINIS